jgi:DNA-directed RNA polymerase specialized sigma24 family protein
VTAHSEAGTGPVPAPGDFADVYERHFGEIHRYIAGRLGRDVADDIAADTFVIALRKRDDFDAGRGTVRAWLYGIATNLVARQQRAELRRYRALARAGRTGPTLALAVVDPATSALLCIEDVAQQPVPHTPVGTVIDYALFVSSGWTNTRPSS